VEGGDACTTYLARNLAVAAARVAALEAELEVARKTLADLD
jgi:hypothetical protein